MSNSNGYPVFYPDSGVLDKFVIFALFHMISGPISQIVAPTAISSTLLDFLYIGLLGYFLYGVYIAWQRNPVDFKSRTEAIEYFKGKELSSVDLGLDIVKFVLGVWVIQYGLDYFTANTGEGLGFGAAAILMGSYIIAARLLGPSADNLVLEIWRRYKLNEMRDN